MFDYGLDGEGGVVDHVRRGDFPARSKVPKVSGIRYWPWQRSHGWLGLAAGIMGSRANGERGWSGGGWHEHGTTQRANSTCARLPNASIDASRDSSQDIYSCR